MATFYGSNATLRDNTVPSKKIAGMDNGGRIRSMYDSFSLSAALSTGDVINMMKIPAGARVLEVILSSPDLDSSTAATLSAGWTATSVDSAQATGFINTVDVHTAAKVARMTDVAGALGLYKQFGAETQVQVQVTAAGNATSGTIQCELIYSLE